MSEADTIRELLDNLNEAMKAWDNGPQPSAKGFRDEREWVEYDRVESMLIDAHEAIAAIPAVLTALERRAEQAEGELYDARVDNRMLAARAGQAEAERDKARSQMFGMLDRAEQAEAALREAQGILQAIRDECDGTGGEFWEGSNEATSDRLRAATTPGEPE